MDTGYNGLFKPLEADGQGENDGDLKTQKTKTRLNICALLCIKENKNQMKKLFMYIMTVLNLNFQTHIYFDTSAADKF